MDVTGKNAALVMLTFLQADCKNAEYRTELLSLVQEINPARDINWNGLSDDPMDDGFLEADGHHISNITALRDILPSVELQQPGEFYYFNRVCGISLLKNLTRWHFTCKHSMMQLTLGLDAFKCIRQAMQCRNYG